MKKNVGLMKKFLKCYMSAIVVQKYKEYLARLQEQRKQ